MNIPSWLCVSFVVLLSLGGCDTDEPTLSEKKEPQTVIQGATHIGYVTDAQVVADAQEGYNSSAAFADLLPVTVESVQIEEFEGRQYLTVIAVDKDGMQIVSSEDYPAEMPSDV